MDDKELIIPDRDEVLVAKIFAAARFAMAWLVLWQSWSIFSIHRLVITPFDWVLIFFLVILYCPYLFSLYMERMWRPGNG